MKGKISRQMLGVLAATLAFSGSALAAGLNIGVVNIARIYEEAPQAVAVQEKLQREFGPRERELVAEQKQIREMEEKLNRDAAIMSENERRKLERDIMARKRDAQRELDAFRDDVNFKRNEALENFQRQMATAIRGFAEAKKYDVILGDSVLYVSDSVDITSQVLDHLKREFKNAK